MDVISQTFTCRSMRAHSPTLQKLLLNTVAALAVAGGLIVATSALDSLRTAPLKGHIQLRPVAVSPLNSYLDTASDQHLEDSSDSSDPSESSESASSNPDVKAQRLYEIRISIQNRRNTDFYVEFTKTTTKSTRLWIAREPSHAKSFGDFNEATVRSSPNGMATLVRADENGTALLLLGTGKYLAGSPTVVLWAEDQFQDVSRKQDQRRAMYLTLFLSLAFFGGAVALMSRDISFLVFSAWLVTSLRVLAMNSGWGYSWIETWIPQNLIPPTLTATLAIHGFLTVSLFGRLYEQERRFHRMSTTLRGLSYTCLVLGALGYILPKSLVHPVLWITLGAGMMCLVVQVVRHSLDTRDTSSLLYVAAWTFMIAGLTGEMASVSALVSSFPGLFNAETGTLACGAIMALALSQRLKEEATSRERAQLAASQANEKSARNYAAMPIGLFGVDSQGVLHVFNPAFSDLYQSILGTSAKASVSRLSDLVGTRARALLESEHSGDSSGIVVEASDSEGATLRYLEFRVSPNASGLEGSVQDITGRVTAEAELARLIDHDAQTKALNQRGLKDAVQRAIEQCKSGVPCALVDIDIDRFKTLNDLYGHLVGDQLLSAVCDALLRVVRTGDQIARIGDSFKVVLLNCDPDCAITTAGRLHEAISEKPVEVAGRVLSVTASVGVVPIDATMDVRDAIAASSQACADAKAKGRNRVVHMAKQDLALRGYLEELKVQENLQDKINSQRLFLEFQPIVSFRSAFETLNYEVLVRMRGENGATISPGRFIPAAERNGQMSMIDRWVLLKTMQWLNGHPEHLKRLDYTTINLSGASLNDARFVDNIFAMMSDFPGVMAKLCFEITETVALADRRATRIFSERVHSMGGKIALDDFGAGYTSFTYLREIEADIIKIDGSFVRDINQNPANFAITRMIVELSHELGKRCVAEWAEHPDVIATLMQLGVDYGQGYALARPLPPESLMFAGSCGDLVTEPSVRALLKGTISPEQVTANAGWAASQPALF